MPAHLMYIMFDVMLRYISGCLRRQLP